VNVDRWLAAIDGSGTRLLESVERAGLDTPCATVSWDGRALVAHQAMVHRWATAHITGSDPGAVPNQTWLIEHEPDLPTFYRLGLASLIDALATAPDDLVAMTFLADAPPPRMFWARRQAHETTIHMVDAVSAELGRVPEASQLPIDIDLAIDGIDELLRGFFTRGRSKLFDGVELDVLVAPADTDRRWLVHVAEKLTVGSEGSAPVTVSGSAVEIYLALWNRGELQVTGDGALAHRWRTSQRVRWS
jgi:uncharacterized protein (TIGR03083 family)